MAVLGNALTTAIPPFVMFGKKVPYLYAEADIEQARRHLSMDFLLSKVHDEPSANVRLADVDDYEYFDGQYRSLTLVYRGPVVSFELAGPDPQPQRLREGLRNALGLIRQALADNEQSKALTGAEAAEYRGAIEDLDPHAGDLTPILTTLAQRFGSPQPFAQQPLAPALAATQALDTGSFLHNLAHELGIAHL